ncbi:MAG: hypothetical protein IGR92_13980 [Leptolyngbyaceae cyanobacterium T60_A2020_046]|nr:hypothetical protein [Leptolyngbyaceae cyanobacterium T60_A2020_046]
MGKSFFRMAQVGLGGVLLTTLGSAGAIAESTRYCGYDPDLGNNPLGMRAYITITEADGTTTFTYEQLGSIVPNPDAPIALTVTRTLTFYDTPLDIARQRLRNSSALYDTLVGYDAPEGYGPVDAVLSCTTQDAQP